MVEKVQTGWGSVRGELNTKLEALDHDYASLSKAAGISYHAARRFRINGAKKRTKAAIMLCKHFGIELTETAKVQNPALGELTTLLAEVWDGSRPHADLLMKLIKSTKSFKIQGRARL